MGQGNITSLEVESMIGMGHREYRFYGYILCVGVSFYTLRFQV